MIPEVVRTASEQAGFDDVESLGMYKGVSIFVPYKYPINGITPPTGLPRVIAMDGEFVRWISGKAAFEILAFFNKD